MPLRAVPDAFNAAEAKERAILDVALRLFSQYGFKRTSVDEIASAAGVAKGTIYLYFESKEALFRSLCAHLIEHVYADIVAAIGDDGPALVRIAAALRTKFGRFFRIVTSAPHGRELVESRDLFAADVFKTFNKKFEALIAGLVDQGLASGELRATSQRLNAKTITQTLLGASRGVSSVSKDAGDFDRRFEAMLAVMTEGLAARS